MNATQVQASRGEKLKDIFASKRKPHGYSGVWDDWIVWTWISRVWSLPLTSCDLRQLTLASITCIRHPMPGLKREEMKAKLGRDVKFL